MAILRTGQVKSASLTQTPDPASPRRPLRVLIPLTSPFLYGMERAVIELFSSLRPEVEPYFLQSNRIFQRNPPIIREMKQRKFLMELLPDKTDWERLAKPRSLKHLWQMIVTFLRINFAIFKGVRGKDVLYVPSISTGSSSLLAAMYCRVTGRRVIHHFHDLGTSNRLFPLWIPLVTDFVHNTKFGFRTIREKLPAIKGKRSFIVPYVMEVDERPPDDPEVCRELSSQGNLMFVGQISHHKGVDLLIEAFKVVAAKHADVKLHLIGDGKAEFRAGLEDEINRAGLNGRVKFWGFREDATRLLKFAYLYVHSSPPSRFHESLGRSVVEAMAHGVPLVCFRSGALQEIVLHGKTGLICDENAGSMASALDRLLTDRSLRDACGAFAAEQYRQNYSPWVILPRWKKVLLEPGAMAKVSWA